MALDGEQAVWLDVTVFEEALADLIWGEGQIEDPARVEEALALYRGDFLEGIFVGESRAIEEWMTTTRERLRQIAIRAQERLALYYLHHRRYPAGIQHARALVHLDPLREGPHRLLMRLLARDGQQNAALAHYQTCRRLLQKELGVAPAEETTALYERVRGAKYPPPHRLPAQPADFVGRDEALATLGRRLDDPGCRLLTLVGPGGAGKTRLAVQAADDRRGEYLNGIAFVNLTPVETVDFIPNAIAEVLDFAIQGKASPGEQLTDDLADKEMLLVLDNFEHLVGEGAQMIQAILEATSEVTLLVTSRERLHLRAEWLFPVQGLPLQEAAGASEVERLFAVCARRVRPGFITAGETGKKVAEICRLVGGLSLGIELAAASLSQHTPGEIEAELQRNLDFLATKMHDVPARHRSLRAAFEYSWALLTADQRQILAQVAVFRDTFDAAAVEAIVGAGPAVLGALVAKSLLRREEDGRYAMHQVIREYAAAKLADHPERQAEAQQRHTTYYADLVANQEHHLGGPQQKNALAIIGRELNNVRLAWTRAIATKDIAAIAQCVGGLFSFYKNQSQLHTGADLFGQAAGRLGNDPVDDKVLMGRILDYHGWFLTGVGAHEQALAQLEQARTYFQEANAPAGMASTLHNIGEIRRLLGDYETADKLFTRAQAIYKELEDPAGLGQVWHSLGNLAMRQGILPLARQRYEKALFLRREQNDLIEACGTLSNLGLTCYRLGEMAAARAYLEEALEIAESYQLDLYRAKVINNLGLINDVTGNFTASLDLYRRSATMHREQSHRYGLAKTEYNIGWVQFCLGDYDAARETLMQNLHLTRHYDLPHQEAHAATGLGLCALEQGDLVEAERRLEAAHIIREKLGDRRSVAWSSHHLGRLALDQGSYNMALVRLDAALAAFRDVSERWGILATQALRGRVYAAAQDPAAAETALCESIEMALPLDGHPFLAEAGLGVGVLLAALGQRERATAVLAQVAVFDRCQQFVRDRAARRLDVLGAEPSVIVEGEALLTTLRDFCHRG